MKTIRNRTRRPLKIQLQGGKVLHLGPGKTGQVSDQNTERPSVVKLVKDGDIEVLGEGEAAMEQSGASPSPSESTHARHKTTAVRPKGNR